MVYQRRFFQGLFGDRDETPPASFPHNIEMGWQKGERSYCDGVGMFQNKEDEDLSASASPPGSRKKRQRDKPNEEQEGEMKSSTLPVSGSVKTSEPRRAARPPSAIYPAAFDVKGKTWRTDFEKGLVHIEVPEFEKAWFPRSSSSSSSNRNNSMSRIEKPFANENISRSGNDGAVTIEVQPDAPPPEVPQSAEDVAEEASSNKWWSRMRFITFPLRLACNIAALTVRFAKTLAVWMASAVVSVATRVIQSSVLTATHWAIRTSVLGAARLFTAMIGTSVRATVWSVGSMLDMIKRFWAFIQLLARYLPEFVKWVQEHFGNTNDTANGRSSPTNDTPPIGARTNEEPGRAGVTDLGEKSEKERTLESSTTAGAVTTPMVTKHTSIPLEGFPIGPEPDKGHSHARGHQWIADTIIKPPDK